jgi:hypothetical protein
MERRMGVKDDAVAWTIGNAEALLEAARATLAAEFDAPTAN